MRFRVKIKLPMIKKEFSAGDGCFIDPHILDYLSGVRQINPHI